MTISETFYLLNMHTLYYCHMIYLTSIRIIHVCTYKQNLLALMNEMK